MSSAGDVLNLHKGRYFTTFDRNNDNWSDGVCAHLEGGGGGWWYAACSEGILNGEYGNNTHQQGVNWYTWHGYVYSLPFAEMKIKPM